MRRLPLMIGLLSLVGAILAASASGAHAAELLYIHEPGCAYCRKWESQVGPIYPLSDAAKVAPLRAMHIRDVPDAGLSLTRGVRYTPTFILLDGTSEVGRIEGYPGEDFFWGLLDRLIEKLDPPAAPAPSPAESATRTSLGAAR